MTVFADVQKFDVGDVVQLFDLDLTPIVASTVTPKVYYFTPSTYSASTSIRWRGNTYEPIDVQATGFERSVSGALPRPKISISGATLGSAGMMQSLNTLLIAYDNLRGATITRWRTLKTYLDNETTSDVTMFVQVDVFVVNQKTLHNKYNVEWELTAYIDYEGQKLPRRQIIKDYCTHIYRTYDTTLGDFVYNPGGKGSTCPYIDSNYFTADGIATLVNSEDICGKRTSDCLKRFPNTPLPTTAFPFVSAVRVR
jgi:lambda family phage minor tail protein L